MVALVILGLSILFLIRAIFAGPYVFKIIKQVGRINQAEIGKGKYDRWRERWDMVDEVNIIIMTYVFWRRFRSFVPKELREELGL